MEASTCQCNVCQVQFPKALLVKFCIYQLRLKTKNAYFGTSQNAWKLARIFLIWDQSTLIMSPKGNWTPYLIHSKRFLIQDGGSIG